jgi:hypothetical protein
MNILLPSPDYKMEAGSSKMSVSTYQTIWYYNTKDHSIRLHHQKKLNLTNI